MTADSLSRREFVAANALLATSALTHNMPRSVASVERPAHASWDMSWVSRLRGSNRTVLDSPQIEDGLALGHAWLCLRDAQDVYHGSADADAQVVVVIRHRAAAMALGDPVWDKYELGRQLNLKDPTSGDPARRNPFFRVAAPDTHRLIPPDASIDTLSGRGVVFLACAFALDGLARAIGRMRSVSDEDAIRDFRGNLVAGAVLMPSGVFAVSVAVRAGCSYIRST